MRSEEHLLACEWTVVHVHDSVVEAVGVEIGASGIPKANIHDVGTLGLLHSLIVGGD